MQQQEEATSTPKVDKHGDSERIESKKGFMHSHIKVGVGVSIATYLAAFAARNVFSFEKSAENPQVPNENDIPAECNTSSPLKNTAVDEKLIEDFVVAKIERIVQNVMNRLYSTE